MTNQINYFKECIVCFIYTILVCWLTYNRDLCYLKLLHIDILLKNVNERVLVKWELLVYW